MAKALCPKCKTVLEQPVPQCPSCGAKFKAKAPTPPAPQAAPVQAAPPPPPKDDVFETIFGGDDEPAAAPAPKPAPRPAPAAAPAAARPAAAPTAPAEAFDHDAARVFAEAFTAKRASAPAEPEPAPPPPPVYEAPLYVPKAAPEYTPLSRLKSESLHPKNLIPGFLFFMAATHIFAFNDGNAVAEGIVPALGAAAALTLLTLGFDYWRFSR